MASRSGQGTLKKASTQENFPPSRLDIEITETALVSDIETAKMILTAE
jgi:predicted signal transduction protein with EAL and GGDEF domain